MKLVLEEAHVVHLAEDVERRQKLEKLCHDTSLRVNFSQEGIRREDSPAMGCLESHLKWIRWANDQSLPYLFILEDDATWDTGSVSWELHTPDTWDMLYLGGSFIQEFPEHSSQNWKCGNILTTHAYILHSSIFQQVIRDLERIVSKEWSFMTIDQYYSCIVHSRQRSFLASPPWIHQRIGFSRIEQALVNYDMVLRPQDPLQSLSIDLKSQSFSNMPGISIITPTLPSRKGFLKYVTLPCILHQDYSGPIEWIILDEQEWNGPSPRLLSHESTSKVVIRHEILQKTEHSGPITIAQKRNVGCELARYSYIVHFDDDDYYPPYSVQLRVQGLLDNSCECVGCTDLFACNYNPNATCANYNLCDYSCQGCTDPTAPNYDADATVDNGTCCSAANWNTISSQGQVIFYAFNPNTGEGDFNEFPYATGYCMNAADCYQLVLYSFMPDSSEVTVTNAQGEVVLSGNLADFGYLQAFVSGANEVAGCTDPSACNYDSNATCDVGSCYYYCGGCLDPAAVNYNADAQFDDGSCGYTNELPNMGLMLVEDEANEQFYVMMELSAMGTGGPYGVVSSTNEPVVVMNTTGQALKGPYACGTEVQFTVHDMGNNMQTAMTSPVYTMACGVQVEETPTKKTEMQLYPNPAKNNVNLVGLEKGTSVEVYDLTGRVLFRDKAQSDRMEISVSKWNAGVYMVRAAGKTMRLVKE